MRRNIRRTFRRKIGLIALALAVVAASLALHHGAFAPLRAAIAAPAEQAPQPPVAKIVPKKLEGPGAPRIDNYFWLRNRDNPDTMAYLKAENAYADARLAPLKEKIDAIAAEMKARIDAAEPGVPYEDNGYLYERRFAAGAAYPVIVRRAKTPGAKTPGAKEEVVLDVPALAAGHAHFALNEWIVSPDNKLVAYAVDFTGGRSHTIVVRDIASGKTVDASVSNASSDLAWAADNTTLFYIRLEKDTLRSYQVWRHTVGAKPASDTLVYEEKDSTFEMTLETSKSDRFILIDIDQEKTSEVRYLAADRPREEPRVIEPRRKDVRYSVDHLGDTFYIRTNLDAPDFRIVTAPQANPGAAHWQTLIAQTPGRLMSRFELFDKFIALSEVHDAVQSVRVVRLADRAEVKVPRPATIGVAALVSEYGNRESATTLLRMTFAGPLQVETTYDFDMATGALTELKRSPMAAWFKPELYAAEQLSAKAPDGEQVPITVVYRKDLRRPHGNPTLVLGYGAYGSSTLPSFPRLWISLIDNGFVFAIAHVRGGREKGQHWYEDGRVFHKRNTFTDFIAATEQVIGAGYADPKRVYATGASAGGLVMGAIANMRPDLYAGIVAEVPFVDIVTSMSDASMPLTTLEYDEWGDPRIKAQYEYMLSYSPYDNVAAKSYPAMLVTSAINDSQVGYHEPAKWVARLRALKTDHNELLFTIDMSTGHSGGSGRFGFIRDQARIIAWLIAQAAKER